MNCVYIIIAKPNHKLRYSVGTNFCLEDTSFSFTIICRLKEEPLPPPTFQWMTNFILNETDLFASVNNIIVDTTYFDNDTLIFSGDEISELDQYSVLDVTCNVSNAFGFDIATTSVKICGMY